MYLHGTAAGWFAEHGVLPGPGGTPNSDAAEFRALSLPMHTRLSDDDVDRVCHTLRLALAPALLMVLRPSGTPGSGMPGTARAGSMRARRPA